MALVRDQELQLDPNQLQVASELQVRVGVAPIVVGCFRLEDARALVRGGDCCHEYMRKDG